MASSAIRNSLWLSFILSREGAQQEETEETEIEFSSPSVPIFPVPSVASVSSCSKESGSQRAHRRHSATPTLVQGLTFLRRHARFEGPIGPAHLLEVAFRSEERRVGEVSSPPG